MVAAIQGCADAWCICVLSFARVACQILVNSSHTAMLVYGENHKQRALELQAFCQQHTQQLVELTALDTSKDQLRSRVADIQHYCKGAANFSSQDLLHRTCSQACAYTAILLAVTE